ncbi:MAG: UDP-2,3-diacylglucosamine diphosphatase LpxI [Devosia sp.]
MARRLTLVAGAGELVPHLAEAARQHVAALQIVDLAGRDDLVADDVVRASLSLSSELIASIKAFGPSHLLLAGAVHISDADRKSLVSAFGLAGTVAGGIGDIGLAGIILLYCKLQRIKLVGAHEIVPELVAPAGHIAGPGNIDALSTISKHAVEVAKKVGAADLGQSVVLSGMRAVAAEDIAGTDALLTRVAELRRAGLVGNAGHPLVLAKARKPKQPAFVDLPAIGPRTIVNAAAAGISVIVVEAGATLLLDRATLAAEASARGVTVIGVKHG